jgi:hypothetical protein
VVKEMEIGIPGLLITGDVLDIGRLDEAMAEGTLTAISMLTYERPENRLP